MKNCFRNASEAFILFLFLLRAYPASAVEYAVPNSGSPYVSFAELKNDQILHVPTGIRVTMEQMMETIATARVIYIGETHDNLESHRIQLEIIRHLQGKGKIAVGMEMFRRSAQQDLDSWGSLSEAQFKKLFHKNWGMGYRLYQPIFEFLKEKHIPLLGLKSNKETEELLRQGDGIGSASLPDMDEGDLYHRMSAMSVFGAHQDIDSSRPYRMLVLWEEAMAQTVAEFLKNPDYKDWKLVVLTGGYHIQYGFGIPKRAYRRVPHPYITVLPTTAEIPDELKDREMNVKEVSIPLYAADFAWKLPYKILPPNRIKLGVGLEELEQGARVRSVTENSSAAKAGIKKNDVFLMVDGQEVIDVDDMVGFLQTKSWGDTIVIKLRRDGSEMSIEAVLQKPEDEK
ncbi:MAG: hypothetical protein A3K09_04870 [Nitrospinae bacterium RIFCSPLOWO2_12_FULL_47_7]|nr:MAG: hypothetical protein A3K09_04870 [Nitrospinae bacterium RIFCSPLOWO2_12_FULL_47_7]